MCFLGDESELKTAQGKRKQLGHGVRMCARETQRQTERDCSDWARGFVPKVLQVPSQVTYNDF